MTRLPKFKRLPSTSTRRVACIALALAVSAGALVRLQMRRDVLQERTQRNLDEARAALDAETLVARQGEAIRALVLATRPAEIADAETRLDAASARCDAAQAHLRTLFAGDPESTGRERALLAQASREQSSTIGPFHRVVALARDNEDERATRILVEDMLPHEVALQRALAELGTVQVEQNRALARGSDERSLTLALVAGVAALAAGLAAWRSRARQHGHVPHVDAALGNAGLRLPADHPRHRPALPARGGFMLIRGAVTTRTSPGEQGARRAQELLVSVDERRRALLNV